MSKVFKGSVTDYRPVILAHGVTNSAANMAHIAASLEAHGRKCFALDFVPHDGSIPLSEYAKQLETFINTVAKDGIVDIVAYSMGAMIAAYYLQEMNGAERTRSFVSIAGPHHGTLLANATVWAGCRDMACGSEFVQKLIKSRKKLIGVRVFTISSDLDMVILPPDSAELPGAQNHKVNVMLHNELLRDQRVLDLIVESLEW